MLLGCLLFAGAPVAGHAGPHTASPTRVLKVWAMGEEGKKLAGLARAFEATRPGVRVEIQPIPWGAAHAKLVTAVVGGIPPDVSQMGTTWMPEFAAMDALLPLDDRLAADPDVHKDAFFPGAWKTVEYGGRVLGLPWYVETRCLYWRKDVLASVGYDRAPRTWEELVDVGRKLLARPHGFPISLPWNDAQTLLVFAWQGGGRVLDDRGVAAVTEPGFRRGLAFYAELFKEGISPLGKAGDLDPDQAFTDEQGTLPFVISGPWSMHRMRELAPEREANWEIAPLPSGEQSASFLGGCDLVIFRGAKNPDLAWEFVRFCSLKSTQVEWFKLSSALPSRPDAWTDSELAGNVRLRAFGEQLKTAQPTPMVPEWEQIADAIGREMEKAVRGTVTVDEATAAMDARIGAILATRRSGQPLSTKLLILGGAALLFLGGVAYYLFRPLKPADMPSGGGLDVTEHSGFRRWVWIFLAPATSLLVVFLVLPVLASFLMSLTNWDIYSVADLRKVSVVGLSNYATVLGDALFWKSVKNTFVFAIIGGPLTILVSLGAALLLEQIVLGKAFFRTAFFLPVVTTLVAVAVVWRWIYHPSFGLLNGLLAVFDVAPREWLTDPDLALPCLIAMAVWKNFGYNMVIFIAGLQAIPRVYYEAAELDGARAFERFTDITMPLLFPTFILVTILTTIGYLQFFAEPYIMTEGGPLDATLSVSLYLYRKGFKFYQMGEAAAMSYVLFVLIFLCSVGQMAWARRREAASA